MVIAIDPGKSGGLAVFFNGKVLTHSMPETDGDVLDLLREHLEMSIAREETEQICVLEQVGGFVGKGQPGSAMFTFGAGFGFLKGCIQALEMRLELVRPQEWQKCLGLGTASNCASAREWKNKLKAEAQRRFPQLRVTHKTADALLIGDYFIRKPHKILD